MHRTTRDLMHYYIYIYIYIHILFFCLFHLFIYLCAHPSEIFACSIFMLLCNSNALIKAETSRLVVLLLLLFFFFFVTVFTANGHHRPTTAWTGNCDLSARVSHVYFVRLLARRVLNCDSRQSGRRVAPIIQRRENTHCHFPR
jgi:hypothetical protein